MRHHTTKLGIPPKHEFTLISGGFMVEGRAKENGSVGHSALAVHSVAVLSVVCALFPLVQKQVFIVLIVRHSAQLGILDDELPVLHVGLPFLHVQLGNLTM